MSDLIEQQNNGTEDTQSIETTDENLVTEAAGENDDNNPTLEGASEAESTPDETDEEETKAKSKIIEVPVSEVSVIECQEDLDQVLETHRLWMDMVLNPKVLVAAGRANLKNADLREYDLTGINFSGANLQGVNLQGVELAGANLTATNLVGASMQACNLRGARLFKTKLQDADLRHADLTDAIIRGVDMDLAITSDDDKRLKKNKEDDIIRCGATAIDDMSDFETFDDEDAAALLIISESEKSENELF
jgi:uncharacterized protein YjbI with pentapeptide repeats